jgi:ribosomal protein S18 acetylase RimI-like enzyme
VRKLARLMSLTSTNLAPMNVRALGPGDDGAVAAAQHLFDGPSDPVATARFLADPDNHLLVGYDAHDRPVGFVSGVEMTHPDKGTEMFLYELTVAEPARRRGVGRALVEALAMRARERGCYGMFVFTDNDNAAALATYHRAGGRETSLQLMLEWEFGGAESQSERANS